MYLKTQIPSYFHNINPMPKKLRKQNYGLNDKSATKYSLFLRDKIFNLEPNIYAVIAAKSIETTHGIMYMVSISSSHLESPDNEPIAEFWINGHNIYIWKDRCWGIAINKYGKEVVMPNNELNPTNSRKTMVLFQIGEDKISWDN